VIGEESWRIASGPEEILLGWFPEGDLWSSDRETFGRHMGWWSESGPEMNREITDRLAGWGASPLGADYPVQ
jgi:hypothetical protein